MTGSRMLIFAAPAVLAIVTGCGDSKPANAPVQTTSASVQASDPQLARLERERNEALGALTTEQTARQREREKFASEAKVGADRDALELRALTAIETADIQLDGLAKKRLNTGDAKARLALEKRMNDTQQYKSKLYADLKKLHGGLTESFDTFRDDVDATIHALEAALGSPRDQSNVGGTTTGVTPAKKPNPDTLQQSRAPQTPPYDTPPGQNTAPKEGVHP